MRVCLLAHNSHGTALYRTVNNLFGFGFVKPRKNATRIIS